MACNSCGNLIGYGASGFCDSCKGIRAQAESEVVAAIVKWLTVPEVDTTDVRDDIGLKELQALGTAIRKGSWKR